MKILRIKLKSTVPLLMHSDRTANQFDPINAELKKITSKRSKTEEDYIEIAKLEFAASCYYRGNGNSLYEKTMNGMQNGWYMPASNLLATFKNAAKNFKLGKRFDQSVNILSDSSFSFPDTSLSPFDLFEKEEYVDMRTVKVQTSKVTRCRPRFDTWSLTTEMYYEESMIDEAEMIKIIDFSSRFIGLCDYRPRFGQFEYKIEN